MRCCSREVVLNDATTTFPSGRRKVFALFGAVLILGAALYVSRSSLPPSPALAREPKPVASTTTFIWCGLTDREEGKNGTAYYRIQGPKLVIEFAPQGGMMKGGPGGGGAAMHVHTVYRDPTNDYGRALMK